MDANSIDNPPEPTDAIFAQRARLPGRWACDVRIRSDATGRIVDVAEQARARPGDRRCRVALPGLPDLHSHAFQRALAGRTQRPGRRPDDFWSWREAMYTFVASLSPDDVQRIATDLYRELARLGYGRVCEFHYVHRDPTGARYSDPAEMAYRLIAAAREAGIGLTLLPAVYQWSGFGRSPPGERQRRFLADVDEVLEIVQRVRRFEGPDLSIGVAAHSLRAVDIDDIRRLAAQCPADAPIHIHAAEQMAEVTQCVAHSGRRPVRRLLDEIGLDARWCIVHATHLDASEIADLARCGATVALCPTTEADLGDGVFPLAEYVLAGGRWGIGSDANVCRDPFAELRLLEYGQRLTRRSRQYAAEVRDGEIGDWLFDGALAGMAACGPGSMALEPGARARIRCLDDAGLDAIEPATTLLSELILGC